MADAPGPRTSTALPGRSPGTPTVVDTWGADVSDYASATRAAAGGSPAPAVAIFPGGGYVGLAEHEATPVAHWFAERGIHAFVVRYPVAPGARYPEILEAGREAMRWIRSGAHGLDVDPARVGAVGFSAGAHLAAMLATVREPPTGGPGGEGARPDFLVLGYPVVSLAVDPHEGSVQALLGLRASDAELRHSLSVDERVTPDVPPAFVWHTADDASVPVSHSLRLAAAYARVGASVELHVYPHGPHGLGLGGSYPHTHEWTVACDRWLRDVGPLRPR